jgi:hypothetical protein
MAKSKSKKPGKARTTEPVVSAGTPKKKSILRGVRKHLRQLQRQLSDAARQESKRLRRLERATFRRQMLQAALEELRGETAVAVAPPAVEAPASAVTATPAAKSRPAAKAKAPATPRPAAKPRVAARPRPAAKATAPAAPRLSAKPSPAAKPRPAAVRTRTTRAATASAKAAPKATPESPAAQKATD